MSEARICNPPRYDEISVANLYDKCLELPGMKDYFPDRYAKGKACSREYFFTILNTLHPEQTKSMIINAKKIRMPSQDIDSKAETIEIDESWKEALKAYPQFASKLLAN